ncbi:MAG: hypothetical protein M1839_006015 [Geoglossum umbratile]|nr:MAG: hypothetical protein M1839_006015 [Geoglossum umbratile]
MAVDNSPPPSPPATNGDPRTELENSQSSGSTIADPDMEQDGKERLSFASSPAKAEEPDPRNTLQHVLSAPSQVKLEALNGTEPPMPARGRIPWAASSAKDLTEDEGEDGSGDAHRAGTRTPNGGSGVLHVAPHTTASRRNGASNAANSSIYTGNKIPHLKREDGIPLWRKDIQYEFLRGVFEDKTAAFTNVYDLSKGNTFADIYVDAMARSSKTSKILRDKLMSDRPAALNMAMVCLLVNVGRMNTTLNFFPEMRAQLRTYHSIPSLQARQDPNAYKQLQDAPRLKSILKGASEDRPGEPNTPDKIKQRTVPRTNPVNLIFVLSQYAPQISERHFSPPRDFFDLIMRPTLSSRSRARGFLWLMWWYLESNFSEDDAKGNPFGPGRASDDGGIPQKLPAFDYLTAEEAALENVDTQEELDYGEIKRLERKRILESDLTNLPPVPKRGKKSMNSLAPSEDGAASPAGDGASPHPARSFRNSTRSRQRKSSNIESYNYDTDGTRSASPGFHQSLDAGSSRTASRPSASEMHIGSILNENATGSTPPYIHRTGRGRWPRDTGDRGGPQRIILKTKMHQVPDNTSPAPPGAGHPVLHSNPDRRQRPLTAHQQAVERNRQQRVEYLLDRKKRAMYERRKKKREEEGSIWRALKRCEEMEDPFMNSEEEGFKDTNGLFKDLGFGGLTALVKEDEDYGEEVAAYSAALRRARRRLDRWGEAGKVNGGFSGTKESNGVDRDGEDEDDYEEEYDMSKPRDVAMGADDDELDDMERELLGEVDPADEEEAEDEDDEMDVS